MIFFARVCVCYAFVFRRAHCIEYKRKMFNGKCFGGSDGFLMNKDINVVAILLFSFIQMATNELMYLIQPRWCEPHNNKSGKFPFTQERQSLTRKRANEWQNE